MSILDPRTNEKGFAAYCLPRFRQLCTLMRYVRIRSAAISMMIDANDIQ